jgi:hypothetical protein
MFFRTAYFSKLWGSPAFQKNVFQNNVFDVPTTVIKVINETINTVESKAKLQSLIRSLDETVSIQSFRSRLRVILKLVSDNVQTTEQRIVLRGLSRALNETVNTQESMEQYMTILRSLLETEQTSESKVRRLSIKRIIKQDRTGSQFNSKVNST